MYEIGEAALDVNRKMSDNDSRAVVFAAAGLLSAVILLAGGAAHRALRAELDAGERPANITPGTLARLPLRIGGWMGNDVPLDERTIKKTDTDDHVSRRYRRGVDSVDLFLGYGVRARDLEPHRPEVCYPAAGWNLKKQSAAEVSLPDGSRLPCTVYRFGRGGFDALDIVVLSYFVVDDEYCPDVGVLRSNAWKGSRGTRYIARVLLSAPVAVMRGDDTAVAALNAFAADSAAGIRELVVQAGKGEGR